MLEGKQVCGAGTGAAREEDAFQKLDQFRNGLHNSLWAQPAGTPGPPQDLKNSSKTRPKLKKSRSAGELFPTQRG